MRVPYDRQQMRGEIFAACEVLGESYDDAGVIFRVRAHPEMLERLQGGGVSVIDSSDVAPPDEVVRCVLEDLPVRIVAATTTAAVREAARRHEAGPAATLALARGLTSGLLLATLTKDNERVTLQILGDGPLGGVTVDATSAGTARAYVKHPSGGLKPPAGGRPSLAAAVGRSRPRQRHPRRRLPRALQRPDRAPHRRDRRGRRGVSGEERAGGERAGLRRAPGPGRRPGVLPPAS